MIASPQNEKLKLIRRLAERRGREREGLFAAEGEDLVGAAERAGVEPHFVLHSGVDVEPELLDALSTLGSGTRVIGVYETRFSEPGGELAFWLDAVGDPGNVGTIIRTAHALCDGPVVLGPDCADPYSPKAVRASMGSIFARPPARAPLDVVDGYKLGLDGAASDSLDRVELGEPLRLCLGSERTGLSEAARSGCDVLARIDIRPDGPESLNVAVAAGVAMHLLANRMTRHV
ncbi:RNA methyltransferase [soil metagenome]